MRLEDYLPTRTFELVVHTADLALALGEPLDAPATAAAQVLGIISDIALTDGTAGSLLLLATGRTGLPEPLLRHVTGWYAQLLRTSTDLPGSAPLPAGRRAPSRVAIARLTDSCIQA